MRWLRLGLLLAAPGCLPITLPQAPAPTDKSIPDLPMPPDLPEPPNGRIVVDVQGEPAKVSKVVEVPYGAWTQNGEPSPYGKYRGGFMKKDEPLCVTPCVLDMPQGAVELSFQSLKDPDRYSTADVVVSSQPTVIRHALGRNEPVNWKYFSGFLMSIFGGMLFTTGGALTGVGLATNASNRDAELQHAPGQQPASPTSMITAGLVVAGVGLLTTAGGIALLNNNRPVHQDGATVTLPIPHVNSRSTSGGSASTAAAGL